MFVCICNQVTSKEIRQAVESGNHSFDAVQEMLGVASCCGQCEDYARNFVDELNGNASVDLAYCAA
ncbi:bacterioferritin-associated ferredoxin [Oleiphilus messinensis]|uniref:Bacterioferritin-associated ferredoxin n=1 Tax=Oleiphilus messinensis TaxID=141451 RepID=A0A1Y0I5S5_9GAMM|nr:(2Fe-2S)-binding protein [Oleiphilus messinensis]ARU55838.1 bacterioferritin-associated ferredoxin [Oleiphilus messinensis]